RSDGGIDDLRLHAAQRRSLAGAQGACAGAGRERARPAGRRSAAEPGPGCREREARSDRSGRRGSPPGVAGGAAARCPACARPGPLVTAAGFSHGGKLVFAAGGTGVRVWWTGSGQLLERIRVPSPRRVAVSPDAKKLAVASAGSSVAVFSIPSGRKLNTFDQPG